MESPRAAPAISARPSRMGAAAPMSLFIAASWFWNTPRAAGFQVGDRIVSVDGRAVDTWDRYALAVGTKANREITVAFVRDGKPMTLSVTPKAIDKFETGDIGLRPVIRPEIAALSPGEAAEADVSVSAGKGVGFIYRGLKMVKKVREDEIVAALRAEIDAWIAEKKAE